MYGGAWRDRTTLIPFDIINIPLYQQCQMVPPLHCKCSTLPAELMPQFSVPKGTKLYKFLSKEMVPPPGTAILFQL